MNFTRHPEVALRTVDGIRSLVDRHGVEIMSLDPRRAAVWEAIESSRDRDALIRHVVAICADTTTHEVAPEVDRFLIELDGLRLISDEGSDRRLTVIGTALPEEVAGARREAAGGDRPLWIDVAGESMRPRIRRGDRVRVTTAGRPRWGEVWAYCHQTGLVVVHRCRGRRRKGFVFHGDAEHRSNGLAPARRLIGRVVAVERAGSSRRIGGADRWTRGLAGQVAHQYRRNARRLGRLARRKRR